MTNAQSNNQADNGSTTRLNPAMDRLMEHYRGDFDGHDMKQIMDSFTGLIGILEILKEAALTMECTEEWPDDFSAYNMTCLTLAGISVARELENHLNGKIREKETGRPAM